MFKFVERVCELADIGYHCTLLYETVAVVGELINGVA